MTVKLRRIAIIMVIALLLVFVGWLSLKKVQQSNLRKTADVFSSEIVSGNDNSSFKLLTSDAQQQNPSGTVWGPFVKRLSNTFSGRHPIYANTAASGKYTIVTYNITGSDGNYVFTLALINEGGWRIDSFTSTATR